MGHDGRRTNPVTQSQLPVRVAYFVSHPIQYQAPLLRAIAADPAIDLTVFFFSDFSLRSYQDAGFGAAVHWDVPLTEGYRSVVLPRWRDTTNPRPLAPISRGVLRALRAGTQGARFQAVWSHGYSSLNSLQAIVAARLLGLPVLLRAEPWLSDRPRSGWKLLVKRAFFRALRPCIAAVLPIGTRNAEYWRHSLGAGVPQFPMPYAVDNEYFAARADASTDAVKALRAELQLDPQRPVILFASKLQERKHCDDLLEAYLRLIADRADPASHPHLLIVGDGEQMPLLREHAAAAGAELVRFAGFRNQSQLPAFFALSTVFVLPSRHEAWGLVVNEAMAAGLPVVVSDNVGCAVDLVHSGENGFVYPVNDRNALHLALAAALEPGVAHQMGRSSRERIAKWSFREDIAGLKAALTAVTGIPIPSQVDSAVEVYAAATL